MERSVFLQPRPLPECWRHRGQQARGGEDDGVRHGKTTLHRRGHCTTRSLPLLGGPRPESAVPRDARRAAGHDPRIRSHNEAQTLPPESCDASEERGVKLFGMCNVWLSMCKLTLTLSQWAKESVKEAKFVSQNVIFTCISRYLYFLCA